MNTSKQKLAKAKRVLNVMLLCIVPLVFLVSALTTKSFWIFSYVPYYAALVVTVLMTFSFIGSALMFASWVFGKVKGY